MASSLISGRPTSLAGVGNKPNAIVPAGGEFYDCVRFCAMFDKPYIARYERKAGKVFQLVGTFKDIETAGPGNGKHSRVIIPFDQIRTQARKERCSWCGKTGGLVLCVHGCEQLICAASVTGSVEQESAFRCRKSCGREGVVRGFIQTVEATKQRVPSYVPGSGAAALAGKGSAAALVPGRLRLKS